MDRTSLNLASVWAMILPLLITSKESKAIAWLEINNASSNVTKI